MTEGRELAVAPTAVEERRRADLARAQAIAKWTDRRFLDPLVGLVLPGVGDALGLAAGLYIVVLAVRHDVPRTVVARMLVNVAVDCLGGVVPVVGDLFDLLNRSNVRNARLLEEHLGAPSTPSSGAASRGLALSVAVALVAAAVAIGVGVAYLVARAVSGGAANG
jgi:hypothetical protein